MCDMKTSAALFSTLLCLSAVALAQQPASPKSAPAVTNKEAELRALPSEQNTGSMASKVIKTLPRKTSVLIFDGAGDWARVKTQDGAEGYVCSSSLNVAATVVEQASHGTMDGLSSWLKGAFKDSGDQSVKALHATLGIREVRGVGKCGAKSPVKAESEKK